MGHLFIQGKIKKNYILKEAGMPSDKQVSAKKPCLFSELRAYLRSELAIN